MIAGGGDTAGDGDATGRHFNETPAVPDEIRSAPLQVVRINRQRVSSINSYDVPNASWIKIKPAFRSRAFH